MQGGKPPCRGDGAEPQKPKPIARRAKNSPSFRIKPARKPALPISEREASPPSAQSWALIQLRCPDTSTLEKKRCFVFISFPNFIWERLCSGNSYCRNRVAWTSACRNRVSAREFARLTPGISRKEKFIFSLRLCVRNSSGTAPLNYFAEFSNRILSAYCPISTAGFAPSRVFPLQLTSRKSTSRTAWLASVPFTWILSASAPVPVT